MRAFLDEPRWLEMAQAQVMRLPKREVKATPGNLERWMRRIGITPHQFRTWAGITTLKEWREMNSEWPIRAVVGLMLEWQEATKGKGEGEKWTRLR